MYRSLIPRSRMRTRLVSLLWGLLASAAGFANPQGPSVVNGDVSFATPNGHTLRITNSPGSIINWNAFNISAGETTRFVQQTANSVVLNRVTGPDSSSLLGRLLSNGHVFLINPNGVLIGRDAVIDTAGLLISSLDIADQDFVAGRLRFEGEGGAIVNHGYIKSAPGGEVILLAPKIVNAPQDGNDRSGLIETPEGNLILAAGRSITISSLDDPDISFDVQAPKHKVVNLGRLLAQGGTAEVLAGTIRHSGEINADTLSVDAGGHVILSASAKLVTSDESLISANGDGDLDGGDVRVSALRSAEKPAQMSLGGGISADGASGGTVKVAGDELAMGAAASITAQGAQGSGGRVVVSGGKLTSSARLDASGKTAGGVINVLGDEILMQGAVAVANAEQGAAGRVRVGGALRGKGDLAQAAAVSVDAGSHLEASALERGDGGTVVVWSTEHTVFAGSAAARGGREAGAGGLIEVSSRGHLDYAGSVDVGAPKGTAGTLLLDPKNIMIVPGGAENQVSDPTPFAGDGFGSSFTLLPNNLLLVISQDADVGSIVDAGEILLFDLDGNVLGSIQGTGAGERLGSLSYTTLADGNLVFRSPGAANGGLTEAGAVILFNSTTGKEIGRVSGTSANEQLGNLVSFGFPSPSTYLVRSPNADIGGQADAGSVVLVSNTTGLALGRVNGTNAGDMLGSLFPTLRGSGNYVLRAPTADPGGITDAGSVYLVNGSTGNAIGRINGNAANEQLGSTVDFFFFGSNDFLIRSSAHSVGANANAGTVILAADVDLGGGNFERGRISGSSADEFLGSASPQLLSPSNNYLVFSTSADIGGNADAGSIIMVNRNTGTALGRVNGTSAGEQLGTFGVTFRASGNYVIRSPDADPGGVTNAGSVILADGSTGNAIGRFDGDTASERFGNTVDFFSLGSSDFLVRAPSHGNGAGIVAQLADVDLGGGNIRRGGVDGATAGDNVGSIFPTFLSTGNYVIRSTTATVGGQSNAGSLFVVDNGTGNVLLQIDGDTANEFLGNNLDTFTLGVADQFALLSSNHGAGAGAIFFVDASDTGGILGTLNGAAGDALGSWGIQRAAGGILVPVPDADPGGISNAGTVLLVDTSATVLGQVDGVSADEFLGRNVDTFSLSGSNFLIHSPLRDQVGGAALAGIGSVILVDGTTGNEIGRVDGSSANEALGNFGYVQELGSGDYVIFSNVADPGGINDAGSVILASATTGTEIGRVDGTSASEILGNGGFVQELSSGDYVVFSPNADPGGVANAGSVILTDGTLGTAIGRADGASANERLGASFSVTERSNGNYFVIERFADIGGVQQAGTVVLVDGAQGSLIGRVDGNTAFERFGTFFDTFTLGNLGSNDVLVRSSTHSPGGINNAGTLVQIADVDLGGGNIVRGRIDGTSASELLGQLSPSTLSVSGNYLVRSPNADPGGVSDAGSIFLVDPATATVVGQINGSSASEFLGNSFPTERGNGNLVILSPNADPGDVSDAGSLILANGSNGNIIGRLNGNNTNERLGNNVNFFSIANSILVSSPLHNNGAATGAGGIFVVADSNLGGGNILRGSVLGTSTDEGLGSFFPTILSNGNLLIRSPNADIGGATDAGSLILANANGSLLGRLNGNNTDERLGNSFSFFGNDVLVVSPLHNNGAATAAGGVFLVANSDLGGGNIVRGRVLGKGADEQLGSIFPTFTGGNYLLRSPNADVGGNVDAGAVILVSGTTGNELGRVSGRSADEQLGTIFPTFLGSGNYLLRSPTADPGGIADAGAVILVKGTDGTEIGRVRGTSADEQLGNQFPIFLGDGNYLIQSPNADVGGLTDAGSLLLVDGTTGTLIGRSSGTSADELYSAEFPIFLANNYALVPSPLADVNGLVDAGSLVQIDLATGLVLQRESGISAGEQLGAAGYQFLPDGRLVFLSPLADVGGAAGAGRLVFFDPTDISLDPATGFTFGNAPDQNSSITVGSVLGILGGGGTLVLQANNDITMMPGSGIQSESGSLTLEAGRSLNLQAAIGVPDLKLVANSPNADGGFKDAGTGDVIIQGTQIVMDTGFISGENVEIRTGSAGIVLANTSLTVEATQNLKIIGGFGQGEFSALASLGELNIDAGSILISAGGAEGVASAENFSSEIFGSLSPDVVLPPVAFAVAGSALNVKAGSISLQGGETADTFAALVSLGEFNIEAGSINMTPGSGVNADAVFLALGGVADITYDSCIGCEELLGDPFADPLAQAGIYIAGLFRDPATEAILALLSKGVENDAGTTEEEEDEDREKPKECN